MNNKITVRDATERWVNSMNAYPLRMIEILYKHNRKTGKKSPAPIYKARGLQWHDVEEGTP